MCDISILTNETYKVLLHLYLHKDANGLVRITQTEIANFLSLSRTTVNNIFKTLKREGYVTHDKSKVGHYFLSKSAIRIIESFKQLESTS